MWRAVDKNGDGSVELGEFLDVLLSFKSREVRALPQWATARPGGGAAPTWLHGGAAPGLRPWVLSDPFQHVVTAAIVANSMLCLAEAAERMAGPSRATLAAYHAASVV